MTDDGSVDRCRASLATDGSRAALAAYHCLARRADIVALLFLSVYFVALTFLGGLLGRRLARSRGVAH